MKKLSILSVSFVIFLMCSNLSFAQENKKINLNAQNIRKAAEAIRKNEALFKDPEMMKRYADIVNKLKKK